MVSGSKSRNCRYFCCKSGDGGAGSGTGCLLVWSASAGALDDSRQGKAPGSGRMGDPGSGERGPTATPCIPLSTLYDTSAPASTGARTLTGSQGQNCSTSPVSRSGPDAGLESAKPACSQPKHPAAAVIPLTKPSKLIR